MTLSETAQLPLVSIVFGAAFVLFGVILTVRVIIGRVKYEVDEGDGGIVDLRQRIRAHGNFAEQAPLAIIALLLAELAGAPLLLVGGLGAALLLTRFLSALGLSRTLEQSSLRKSGAGATQLTLVVTVGVVLYYALSHLTAAATV